MSDSPAGPLGFWRIAASDPGRVAIIDADGTTTTYGELLGRSRGAAATFARLGIVAGDHVAMMLPNHRSFLEVLLGALESGLVLTPVNSHLAAAEVAHVLSDSDARAFVSYESLATTARSAAHAAGLPSQRCFAVGAVEGFRAYDDLVGTPSGMPDPRLAGATMMYTSGTTGKPKGVKRSSPGGDPDDVFGSLAAITCEGFGVPVGPHVHLVCGPLYHAGPFVGAHNALHVGATLVLMDKWTPERCLALIEEHRVASTQMVPTMFHRLLSLPDEVRTRADVSSIKSVFHTGAPCPVPVKQQIMDWWGPVVYETYGGTESAATIARPKRWLERPGTVGRAIHGVTVRILDADGTELPTGSVGEIWIDTGENRSEYYKDPAKTSASRRGSMVTLGDIGYLDADGYLFLRDRKIDMIISGGANIYPAEVESALLEDERIADATVIGVPDDEWGEQVKAIVELKPGVPGDETTASSIIAACRDRIAHYKCPRTVDFVADLPRLPNGKVEKRRLRDPYWAGRDSTI